MPNRGGRTNSGPWGRLKLLEQDPLESMGLPSKGETKLHNFKAQERYYNEIVKRYMRFCSDAGKPDELRRRFASLRLTEEERSDPAPPSASMPPSGSTTSAAEGTRDLFTIIMSLRKLREGIVASKRIDPFATQAYMFTIRLGILVKHTESYHPAILYLLRSIHPILPLSSLDLHEVVSYLVLDTACRRGDLAEAYALRQRYKLRERKVDTCLKALAHDNYVMFRKVKRAVDGHKARLMDFADQEVRTQTLKCFGRAYLSVDVQYLEMVTAARWDDMVKKVGVGWELDEGKVIIRKIKAK